MIPVLIIFAILVVLFFFSLMGRRNHPGLAALRGWAYAHRGLHSDGVPENSMAAFKKALDNGYGIELDIHLMKDGNLAVIHDASLKRTAGAAVNIEDLTAEDLSQYRLEGTDEPIPLFKDVLAMFEGKAPMIVELKAVNNFAELCHAACAMLEKYNGIYCLESFDPRCIIWLKKNRPELIRGQLAENFIMNPKSKIPFMLKLAMSWNLGNFLSRPDFIAYRYADRNHFSVYLCRKLWKLQGVSWTIRTKEEYDIAVKEGWIPIFENFIP